MSHATEEIIKTVSHRFQEVIVPLSVCNCEHDDEFGFDGKK